LLRKKPRALPDFGGKEGGSDQKGPSFCPPKKKKKKKKKKEKKEKKNPGGKIFE